MRDGRGIARAESMTMYALDVPGPGPGPDRYHLQVGWCLAGTLRALRAHL